MIAIVGPLLVPGALLVIRLASGAFTDAPAPALDWQLLLVVGPAVPVYLALLPLLPIGVARLRRGWRPHRLALWAACAGLGMFMDAVFYLAAD